MTSGNKSSWFDDLSDGSILDKAASQWTRTQRNLGLIDKKKAEKEIATHNVAIKEKKEDVVTINKAKIDSEVGGEINKLIDSLGDLKAKERLKAQFRGIPSKVIEKRITDLNNPMETFHKVELKNNAENRGLGAAVGLGVARGVDFGNRLGKTVLDIGQGVLSVRMPIISDREDAEVRQLAVKHAMSKGIIPNLGKQILQTPESQDINTGTPIPLTEDELINQARKKLDRTIMNFQSALIDPLINQGESEPGAITESIKNIQGGQGMTITNVAQLAADAAPYFVGTGEIAAAGKALKALPAIAKTASKLPRAVRAGMGAGLEDAIQAVGIEGARAQGEVARGELAQSQVGKRVLEQLPASLLTAGAASGLHGVGGAIQKGAVQSARANRLQELRGFRANRNTQIPDTLPDTLPDAPDLENNKWIKKQNAVKAELQALEEAAGTLPPEFYASQKQRLEKILISSSPKPPKTTKPQAQPAGVNRPLADLTVENDLAKQRQIEGQFRKVEGAGVHKVYDADKKPYNVKFEVVEAGDVHASTKPNFTPNENYQYINTRNRAGDRALQVQSDKIGRDLKPELLGESGDITTGSPIIGKDNNSVLSGNGRTIGVQRAYSEGVAEHYKQHIVQNAEKYGLSREQAAGMKQPVLVRRLMDDVDHQKFIEKANTSDVAKRKPSEQAYADAESLGSLDKKAATEFIQNLPDSERTAVISDNRLNLEGQNRLALAKLAKAFGSSDIGKKIVRRIADSGDDGIKRIARSLGDHSKSFIDVQDAVKGSKIGSQYDITNDYLKAVDAYTEYKAGGYKTLEEYFGQGDFLAGGKKVELNDRQQAFFDQINKKTNAQKDLSENLKTYFDDVLDEVVKSGQPSLVLVEPRSSARMLNDAFGSKRFPEVSTEALPSKAIKPEEQLSPKAKKPESILVQDQQPTQSQPIKNVKSAEENVSSGKKKLTGTAKRITEQNILGEEAATHVKENKEKHLYEVESNQAAIDAADRKITDVASAQKTLVEAKKLLDPKNKNMGMLTPTQMAEVSKSIEVLQAEGDMSWLDNLDDLGARLTAAGQFAQSAKLLGDFNSPTTVMLRASKKLEIARTPQQKTLLDSSEKIVSDSAIIQRKTNKRVFDDIDKACGWGG